MLFIELTSKMSTSTQEVPGLEGGGVKEGQ